MVSAARLAAYSLRRLWALDELPSLLGEGRRRSGGEGLTRGGVTKVPTA